MLLITMNVAVFVGVLVWTRGSGALTGSITEAHVNLGLSKDVLARPLLWNPGSGDPIVTEPGGWYRLVTSGFMHFGVIHIALNMYFLYVLGPLLEPSLGRARFLLLYMASLLGGSLGVLVFCTGFGRA